MAAPSCCPARSPARSTTRPAGSSWVAELGGGAVHLVWVRSDPATVRHRLAARGLERDAGKLASFGEFTEQIQLGAEPAVPHFAIDNRLSPPCRWRPKSPT